MGALVTMCKGGDTLDVHPTCVAAHALHGWQLAPVARSNEAAPVEKPATTTTRKARRESAPAPTEQTE